MVSIRQFWKKRVVSDASSIRTFLSAQEPSKWQRNSESNQSRVLHFIPMPIIGIGLAIWIVLWAVMRFMFFSYRTAYNGEPIEIVIKIIEEALRIAGGHVAEVFVTACAAGWVAGLIVLLLNWIVPERRKAFRKPLMEWSKAFFIVTVGMYAILQPD